MRARVVKSVRSLSALGIVLLTLGSVAVAADLGTEAQKAAGKVLYDKYCAQCHGDKGDADTPAAAYYKPRPRDFTSAKYKVRMTPNGELPLDSDIARAIKLGLAFNSHGAYTVMPPWPTFSDEQIQNLVYYLKTFSVDFADPDYNNPSAISIGSPIASGEESVKRGREVFEGNECIKCHGDLGRGDGRSAPTLEDDWGNHVRPVDLTKRWTFRGGGSREDIFRTISTGFNGTPMPSYADTVSEEDRWHLVNYIYSLSDSDLPNYSQPDKPIRLTPIDATVDMSDIAKARESFSTAPEAIIPVVGQVIEPGRALYPGANELRVRAVYNDEEVAFLLSWHDMSAETSGDNTPDMEVPMFEGDVVEESDDPFGEDEEEEEDPFAEEEEGSSFADAVAIQIPSQLESGFVKPYFIFGDSQRSVDLLFVNLASKSAKMYTGRGSDNLSEREEPSFKSIAEYKDGKWSVVVSRARIVENGVSFDSDGAFVPVAFSVWDGFEEERGNKRGLTSWFSLYQEPREKPSAIKPMLMYGIGLLLLELLVVWWVRRRCAR